MIPKKNSINNNNDYSGLCHVLISIHQIICFHSVKKLTLVCVYLHKYMISR